jgi:hypothetical protein
MQCRVSNDDLAAVLVFDACPAEFSQQVQRRVAALFLAHTLWAVLQHVAM